MNERTPLNNSQEVKRLTRRLERERKAREEAERLLEQKSSELYDASEQLAKEVHQVRILSAGVEAARDGVALMDKHGNCSYMNPAFAEIFGYETSELLGQSWRMLFDSAERDRFISVIYPQFERDGVWRGEALGQSKAGEIIVQDVVLSRLPDEGFLYSLRDITQRRGREKYARDLEERLLKAERDSALFTFGNAVAHDFNNLIAAINGNVTMMKMDLQNDPDNYYRAHQIELAIQQAANVIRSLEIERSNEVQLIAPLDLVELMNTGLQIASAIQPTNIAVHTSFPSAAQVETNEVLLTRCLLNISTNAFAAMNEGGTFDIKIGKRKSKPIVSNAQMVTLGTAGKTLSYLIELTDDGTGINPEKLTRIFDEFYTTKPKLTGSGLGLESLKALVEASNVFVEVESSAGVGTRFRLSFYSDEEPAAQSAAKTPRQMGKTKAELTIMLVDDDALVGHTLKEQIESRNHHVTWHMEPAEALDAFKLNQKHYDLVITDLTMPGMSGKELAAQLKQLSPNIPIILYSGQTAYIEKDSLYAAILQKPITLKALEAALVKAVS